MFTKHRFLPIVFVAALVLLTNTIVFAQPPAGGTLDPTTIGKFEIPLVIPPVMNHNGTTDSYDIAVRQFQQQILPGGIWETLGFTSQTLPPTTVWSYGPDSDQTPAIAPDPNSQFNYPAYTFETMSDVPVSVRWINDLVDGSGNYLPHLLPVDQTLHWANPPKDCRMGDPRTDCAGDNPANYTGPVPIVTHVHGAHVDPHSDGYPEAWWLPAANNLPAGYATSGALFDDATGANGGNLGYADYLYRQDQPATTLWYHDHSLGMTRLNVYAGPAGFWLIRGGKYDKIKDTATGVLAVLPGPAPVYGDTVLELNAPGVNGAIDKRSSIREIPIAIQDRSFNDDGSLFYPDNRAFFEGLNPEGTNAGVDELQIDFVPDSDIAPVWNPEAFFNVMVVNGVAWPNLDVAPAKYRFRLLNGCNSRFLNLALKIVGGPLNGTEIPFFQIGAEQGFLPNVVRIETGFATPLPGNGMMPAAVPGSDPQQALLMALAERADVIVDFGGLPDGTVIRMINTAPDAPFGGFPDTPADPSTTGQVMEFTVNSSLLKAGDALTTSPYWMKPKEEEPLKLKKGIIRQVSLNEGESEEVCVKEDIDGNLVQVALEGESCPEGSELFAPKEALLGTVDFSGGSPEGVPLKWTDNTGASTPVPVTMADGFTVKMINVTENPRVGDTEDWEIYNFTMDAHPIHLHLVRFNVIERRPIDNPAGIRFLPEPWESGYKDTVIAYPGEITTVRANFDVPGLYVWHCHIVEHEDNEMMRPYVVSP